MGESSTVVIYLFIFMLCTCRACREKLNFCVRSSQQSDVCAEKVQETGMDNVCVSVHCSVLLGDF